MNHYSENWGGYRLGAGRKENFDTQFVGAKKPHSIYCTDLEADYIKFFILQKRALTVLMNYEPIADNPNKYNGDQKSWDRDFDFLQNLNLWKLSDPEYQKSQKTEIEKILNRCLKDLKE